MMAREAGVRSAWARYGTAHPAGAWETLVAVTHWTDEDVAREQELRLAASGIAPDVTLDRFGDLLAKVGIYGNANNEDKAVQQVQRVRVR